jgi:uncharacterized DUF497 family protein
VDFEWDPAKAARNLEAHGVDFADAAVALEDDRALTIEDTIHEDEQRFVSVCLDPLARLLVVVYAWRGNDTIRIISARKATKTEIRRYEGEP